MALTLGLGAAAAGAEVSLDELLRRQGIQPLDPSTAAADFRLPTLDGEVRTLSEFHGRWVLLTFFATWCGPCRKEMPSLERLHQQRENEGLVVLAVSVDRKLDPVAPFVQRLGLSFPVLWDQDQQAGVAYRARSIPVSYLIDPAGRVVGVARGARDWAAMLPTVDRVLALQPPEAAGDPLARAPQPAPQEPPTLLTEAPLALPPNFDPPTAEVNLLASKPRPGEPFDLEIRLQWAGSFESYLPHSPKVTLPAGLVQEGLRAATNSVRGTSQVLYTVTLRAQEPGTYALDPVELRYTPHGEASPLATQIPGPTVEVARPKILGLAPATLAAGTGAAVLLGALGFFGLRRRRQGRGVRRRARSEREERHRQLSETFAQARRQRLDGDSAGALAALADLDRELGADPSAEGLHETLEQALERARYGGRPPAAETLDLLERRLRRRLEDLRPVEPTPIPSPDRASFEPS